MDLLQANFDLKCRPQDRSPLLQDLRSLGPLGTVATLQTVDNFALIERLCERCPCLYTQVAGMRKRRMKQIPGRGVVHLSEITLGAPLNPINLEQAFDIQHPHTPSSFLHTPARATTNAGGVTEAFCVEVLLADGFKCSNSETSGWIIPSFINLNRRPFHTLSSFGDVLIPAAPSNIIVSCKTVTARERLLNSGIRVDTVGFGFFGTPAEFWSAEKPNIMRRFGFTAVYMPSPTLSAIRAHVDQQMPLNVNGSELYRPLTDFTLVVPA